MAPKTRLVYLAGYQIARDDFEVSIKSIRKSLGADTIPEQDASFCFLAYDGLQLTIIPLSTYVQIHPNDAMFGLLKGLPVVLFISFHHWSAIESELNQGGAAWALPHPVQDVNSQNGTCYTLRCTSQIHG